MNETPIEQWADAIEARAAGRVVQVYRETSSTQDQARALIASRPSGADGALIVAAHQTAGRGRLGRKWHSPAGTALTFSMIYRVDHATLDRVTFAASVALAEALDKVMIDTAYVTAIKWPNDIYIEGRKIAGILVEVVDGFAIVGLGINVHLRQDQLPEPIAGRATSLAMCGVSADRLAVLLSILERMDNSLGERSEPSLLEGWRTKCKMFEHDVRLKHDGQIIEGRVIDLDPLRGLKVLTGRGDVVHLPAATTTVLDYPV